MCTFIIDLNIVMSNIEFLQCDKLEFRQTAGSGHTACPGHTIFSTHKYSIGKFPYWKCSVKINPDINCRQKQRSKLIPESAYLDLMKYKNAGVFCDSPGGADKYLANITLTRRPSARKLKYSTKQDKYLSQIKDKHKPNQTHK